MMAVFIVGWRIDEWQERAKSEEPVHSSPL
jgi:hypothetical protein